MEEKLQFDLGATVQRARDAFPSLTWMKPHSQLGPEGPTGLSETLDGLADFVERAAVMQAEIIAAAAEEVAAVRTTYCLCTYSAYVLRKGDSLPKVRATDATDGGASAALPSSRVRTISV